MEQTIEQLIAKLQEIQKANPGIKVVHSDIEHGISALDLKVERLMPYDRGHRVTNFNDDDYNSWIETISQYQDDAYLLSSWSSLGSEDQQEYYGADYSNFLDVAKAILANHIQKKESYESAKNALIFTFTD